MRVTQSRPPERKGVTVNTPSNVTAKVSRDKVEINDGRISMMTKGDCRVVVNKEDEDDWRSFDWFTVDDQKKLAEQKLLEAKANRQEK